MQFACAQYQWLYTAPCERLPVHLRSGATWLVYALSRLRGYAPLQASVPMEASGQLPQTSPEVYRVVSPSTKGMCVLYSTPCSSRHSS
jgi:hypothetical protein